MGGRVRGTLRADSGCYDFEDAVHILQNIVIPESQDSVVVLSQPPVADAVRFTVSVLPTIDLQNQTRFPADKIDNVRANRLLANELAAFDRSRT